MTGRKSITEILSLFPNNSTIIDAVIKTEDHIARQAEQNGKILVSVSGGSDSDIMIDMIEKIGYPSGLVVYVWFDTGLEYAATKRHLFDLEDKYGIIINRRRAEVTVPLAVKRYGVPFFAKIDSEHLGAMQELQYDFASTNSAVEDAEKFKCKGILIYWHNANKPGMKPGRFEIERVKYLKEFIVENPPKFRISSKCCYYAKKKTAHRAYKDEGATLSVIGVRKAEGGARSATKSCYTDGSNPPIFRPLFWLSDADKAEYKEFCGVRYSDCYEVWGFKRTGCVGCPFNSKAQEELAIAERYEPLITNACRNIFGESYAYRAAYNEFKERMKSEKHRKGQMILEGFE